jgi:hypothetical protein
MPCGPIGEKRPAIIIERGKNSALCNLRQHPLIGQLTDVKRRPISRAMTTPVAAQKYRRRISTARARCRV